MLGSRLCLLTCALLLSCGSHVPPAPSAGLADYVAFMRVDDANARRHSGDALRALGADAVPELVEMLSAEDSSLKQSLRKNLGEEFFTSAFLLHGYAASALGELGPVAESAVPALVAASTEIDPTVTPQFRNFVAVRAQAALIKIRGEPLTALAERLADSGAANWEDALATAEELGSYGEPLVPVLIRVLEGPEPARRMRAANALGRIGGGGELSVPALTAAVGDEDDGVRFFAMRALASLGTKAQGARSAVALRLEDPAPSQRRMALETLVAIVPAEEQRALLPLFAPLLTDAFEEVRFVAQQRSQEISKRAP